MRFLPLQPLQRLNELLGLADVHLLPQRMDAEDLVMPSKLTAILASGRPVVASARAGSDVAHAAGTGGLIVPPGDATAFAAALRHLLEDDNLRAALGRSGRAFAVANLDRETILRNAKLELDALLGETGTVLAGDESGFSGHIPSV
jgi:colanic acid biosynthesis glycosyl transferase WcaI